jgi:hypothetical protein
MPKGKKGLGHIRGHKLRDSQRKRAAVKKNRRSHSAEGQTPRARSRKSPKPRLPSLPPPDTSSFEVGATEIVKANQRRSLAAVLSAQYYDVSPPQPPIDGPDIDDVAPSNATSPIPDVANLENHEALEVITEWFHSNFEEPVQATPRLDGEYLYIWGGPYDARDEISDAFGDQVSEAVIDAAVNAVQAGDVLDWAPHHDRWGDDTPRSSFDPGPEALHAKMLVHIAELEAEIAKFNKHRGIGANNPPEQIDGVALPDGDRRVVEAALATLKSQPATPSTRPADAQKAVDSLWSVIKKYCGEKADTFVSEAIKSAGKELGKRAIQAPFWLPLIYTVVNATQQWLNALPH